MTTERQVRTPDPPAVEYRLLCRRAIKALHWLLFSDNERTFAYQLRRLQPNDGDLQPKRPYPTATSHILLALVECGVQSKAIYTSLQEHLDLAESTLFDVSTARFPKFPHPLALVESLLRPDTTPVPRAHSTRTAFQPNEELETQTIQFVTNFESATDLPPPASLEGSHAAWLATLYNCSSHTKDEDTTPLREAIFFGHLLPAIAAGVTAAQGFTDPTLQARLICGAYWTAHRLCEQLSRILAKPWGFKGSAHFTAPYLLLHAAFALVSARQLLNAFAPHALLTDRVFEPIDTQLRNLCATFEAVIDKFMARRYVANDPYFDVGSLTFALRGFVLLEKAAHTDSLFADCLSAIIGHQHPNGLWPDGIGVSRDARGSQQPSVEISLHLAQSVFRESSLFRMTATELAVLETLAPALRRFADCMFAMRKTIPTFDSDDPAYGWSNDRTRLPDTVEGWVTAMAARVFNVSHLIDRACKRARILAKYDVPLSVELDLGDARIGSNATEVWKEKVIDPDAILEPAKTIEECIISPIEQAAQRPRGLIRPSPTGVSFILFGPPGSGKTFLVQALATSLGWPLISLNPGNFIKNGVEGIEQAAAEVFKDIMNLDHCVVLFDECDELFRERRTESGSLRTILTFATASMLPKLQALHSLRRVIFVVATNYLHNIDDAVRRGGRFSMRVFFDRPDSAARKMLITRELARMGLERNMSKADIDKRVCDTSGLTFDDILSLSTSRFEAIPLGENRVALIRDYADWCVTSGKRELDAGGIVLSDQNGIESRWKSVPGYDQACERNKRQRRGKPG